MSVSALSIIRSEKYTHPEPLHTPPNDNYNYDVIARIGTASRYFTTLEH